MKLTENAVNDQNDNDKNSTAKANDQTIKFELLLVEFEIFLNMISNIDWCCHWPVFIIKSFFELFDLSIVE